jgi:hypothetical protein
MKSTIYALARRLHSCIWLLRGRIVRCRNLLLEREKNMKSFYIALMAVSVLSISRGICADQEAGSPIGFIGGCRIDLNADDNPDSALLLDASKGYELIVILSSGLNAKTYHVANPRSKMHLACHHGKQLKETDAGPGKKKGKSYQTNGAYLKLSQPEGASAAYFWSEDKFKEVWLSD